MHDTPPLVTQLELDTENGLDDLAACDRRFARGVPAAALVAALSLPERHVTPAMRSFALPISDTTVRRYCKTTALMTHLFHHGTTNARMRQNTVSSCTDSDCIWCMTQGRMVFPSVRPGQHHEEQDHRLGAMASSCADTINNIGPQIRTQCRSRNAGLSLDRQHKLGGHSALRACEPIPDLGLCGADTIGQGFLAPSQFAGSLECFC